MNKYKNLGKNTVIFAMGEFGQRVLVFLFVPFYTKMLSPNEYGIADLVTTTVSLLFPVFTAIISEAVMRFALNEGENKQNVFTVGMSVWLIGTGTFYILSPIIKHISELKPYYYFILLYYTAYSINLTLSYFTRGIKRNVEYAISGIISSLVTVILNIVLLAIFRMGVQGYLISYILSGFISSIYLFVACNMKQYIISLKYVNLDIAKRMLKYSLPLIPNSISWWISNFSNRFLLTSICGATVTGIFSVANKIPSIVNTCALIFMNAWRVSVVEEYNSESSDQFYSEILEGYITVTVIITSSLMILNKLIAQILFDQSYYSAWLVTPLLLVAATINTYCDFFGVFYTSALRTRSIFLTTTVGAFSNIILNLGLIPQYGGVGAAFSTLFSYCVILFLRVVGARKLVTLRWNKINTFFVFSVLIIQMVVSMLSFKFETLVSIILLCIILKLRKFNIEKIIMGITKKGKKNENSIK